MVRLPIQCPQCHLSDLIDNIQDAYCSNCQIRVILGSLNYDQLRDLITITSEKHKEICANTISTDVDEYVKVCCPCGFFKHVAYFE